MSGCESDEKIKATPPIKIASCHEILTILELQFADVAHQCCCAPLFVGDIAVHRCRRMSYVTVQRTLAQVNDINVKGVEDVSEPKQIGWSETDRSSSLCQSAVKICVIIMNVD